MSRMDATADGPGVDLTARFALLWEPAGEARRGRPARVSRAQVVDAAVALADADGLDAVSMRSVATSLGVAAMTLYSHVPGRTELVDAMIDRAYSDWGLPDAGMPWRPALEAYARGYWQLLRHHAWLLEVNPWRLPLAPHVLEAQEAGYRCLVDTGLTPQQVVETVDVVTNAVAGLARAAAVEAAEESSQGIDYAAHWAGTDQFWERHFDPARFPTMTRLWTSGAFHTAATPFELRLGGLLDTIGLLIEHTPQDGPAIPSFEECLSRLEHPAG
jgi:AcrR family transcriptional regulator